MREKSIDDILVKLSRLSLAHFRFLLSSLNLFLLVEVVVRELLTSLLMLLVEGYLPVHRMTVRYQTEVGIADIDDSVRVVDSFLWEQVYECLRTLDDEFAVHLALAEV